MTTALIIAAGSGAALAATSAPADATTVHAQALQVTGPLWQDVFAADAGHPIAQSSPIVATLDGGGPAVVVGDGTGKVYALHLSDGSSVGGWPVQTGAAIGSAPSVSGSGASATVYVTSGTPQDRQGLAGGYYAFAANGARKWFVQGATFPTGGTSGTLSSPAVGTLQQPNDVVAGDMGQELYEINGGSGAVEPGFPWLQADSNFSTAAIADVTGSGSNDIVVGGASTYNPTVVDGEQYTNGGHIRILRPTGNAGQQYPNQGLVCQYNTDQEVDSSPAVGTFLSGGRVGIVTGTGTAYAGASTTNDLIAVDSGCNPQWQVKLDSSTSASPALIDALGNGSLQVAEGASSGSVYLLNGANGATIWHVAVPQAIIGSVTSADFTGAGYQDVVVPTINGVYILDGRTGATVATLAVGIAEQNSPLITQDANGTIGITVAGYNGANNGTPVVEHFEVAGSNGSLANESGAWPMFHHDAQLTGNAGVPGPPHCTAPGGGPLGYEMAASDGGVFNFGNTQFCGSTGNVVLNQPVVGTAATPDGGGYWLVARDGGVFDFGDAPFYGSTGNIHLNQPIVGMAATPDGKGYWLVASDGGVFSFGDAQYFGSTGNVHLNQPIVGMAATPDGGGYWLVARDGGVFNFGDAAYFGSTGNVHLNQPIIGMAAVPGGGGYWLAAADGGIFQFGTASFYGSTGNVHLNQPIVAIAPVRRGGGYWLFASDGGVFQFGDAPFYGSTGNIHLNQPIVGAGGYN